MKHTKAKRLLITGAASGIGAATARLAVSRGCQVLLADVNLEGARAVAGELGDAATAVGLDIRSPEQWERALDQAWARLGGLDVLINNAAIVHTGHARDVTLEQHRHTLDTNFMGPLIGMMAALPRFRAQRAGHFVTVCSMTAFLPFPGLASYAAAKHALRAFHHAVSLEERHGPLNFTIVHPTATETPMLEQEARDDALALAFAGPAVSPDYVAGVIFRAMELKSVEIFMPAGNGRTVRLLGTSPKALRKLVDQNEVIGLRNLQARRAQAVAANV